MSRARHSILLAALLSLALLSPAATRASSAAPEPPGIEVEKHLPTCEELLAAKALHGDGHGEGHSPSPAEVIFHHVSDSHALEFESPISAGHITVDFKQLLCEKTGWNGVVHLGSLELDLTPTKHLFFMWVAAIALFVLLWRARPKEGQLVPKGGTNFVELLVLFVRDEIARKSIPMPQADRSVPYLCTAFFFILSINVLGLIPYMATASGNIAVTAGLALVTFGFTQVAGIRAAGLGGYLKHLTGGVDWWLWPIMIPVEFIGLFTKPFALTIRLFANMVAGHIVIYFLIALIFMVTAFFIPISVGLAFAIYLLELFVSVVQAYVFTMLSSVFIGFGVAMGHHGHEAGEHAAQDAEHSSDSKVHHHP